MPTSEPRCKYGRIPGTDEPTFVRTTTNWSAGKLSAWLREIGTDHSVSPSQIRSHRRRDCACHLGKATP